MTPELTNALHGFRLTFLCKPIVSLTDLSFLKAWVNRHVPAHPALKTLETRLSSVTNDAEVVSLLAEFVPEPAPLIAFHGLLGAMCNHHNTQTEEFVRLYMAALEASSEIHEECPETFYLKNYPYKRDLQIYYQDLADAMDVEPGRVGETLERFIYFLGVFEHFRWDNFEDWNQLHSQVQQRMYYLREKGKATGYYMADPQDLWSLDKNRVYDLKPLEQLVYPSSHKEFNPLQPTYSELFPPQENTPSISPFTAFWRWLFG